MSSTYQSCVSDLSSDGTTPTAEQMIRCISSKFDQEFVSTVENASSTINNSIDTFFLLYAATLVFFMQTGFAMLCAGCVQLKNVQNTLLKNLLDACGAAIGYYTVGYAFAWGNNPSNTLTTFIGNSNFFLIGVEDDVFWLFQFAFCATSATIVAGTLAERCRMAAYLAYSIMLSAFVYPVVVHSIWSPNGFLSASNANPLWGVGMVDFAGSTVVHITGGLTAFVATKILGPRAGRFYDLRGNILEVPKVFPGHSLSLQMLGTFILWFGWYGFNCGSMISVTDDNKSHLVGHTAITTTLGAATGAITALSLHSIYMERIYGEVTLNLQYAMNGCLSGLVSVTAGCAVIESWAAIVIGIVAGTLYLWTSMFLVRRRIDDAVDAIPVHLINGVWGTFAVGLFATPTLMENVYGSSDHAGWFYELARGSVDGYLLACQLVGILFVAGWTLYLMAPFFLLLNYFGWLRVDTLEEVVGLDIGYSGGTVQSRLQTHHDEVENNMDEYVKEYLKRKEARMYLKKDTSIHGGMSRLDSTGSGPSGNGRIIRGIESLEWGKEFGQLPKSRANSVTEPESSAAAIARAVSNGGRTSLTLSEGGTP